MRKLGQIGGVIQKLTEGLADQMTFVGVWSIFLILLATLGVIFAALLYKKYRTSLRFEPSALGYFVIIVGLMVLAQVAQAPAA